MTISKPHTHTKGIVRIRDRAILLLAAYGIAALLLGTHLEYFIFFPSGLFHIFGNFENVNFMVLVGLGWILYLAATLSIFLTKRKIVFIVLFSILVILLILNVSGCSGMLHDLEMAYPNL